MPSFLDRSTGDLLDLFGAGKNVPGAGSAAALQGALAGSLIQAKFDSIGEGRSTDRAAEEIGDLLSE